MRFSEKLLLIFIGLCSSWLSAFTKEVRDTIVFFSKDYVYVKYDIKESNGKVRIKFSEVRIKMGRSHKDKYAPDPKEVFVLFFERGGGYNNVKFKGDIHTKPWKVPSDRIHYQESGDGYVKLEENAEISLDLRAESAILSLPVYLVHYEKKKCYKVFAECKKNLEITLRKKKKQEVLEVRTQETVRREIPITEQVEGGTDMSPEEKAMLIIDIVEEKLRKEDLSLEELDKMHRDINDLEYLGRTVSNEELRNRIKNIIQDYDSLHQAEKQRQKQEEKTEEAVAQQQAKEEQIKKTLAYVQDRLDSIDKLSDNDLADLKNTSIELRKDAHGIDNSELAQQMKATADKCDTELKKIEDGKKKRNILLIVLGIVFGILLFVGNQFIQHFRNKRNMKSMEDAQNKIAKRAEDEAKRRAHAAVRSKVNAAQGRLRQKQDEAVRDMGKSVVKGIKNKVKKDLSI